MLGLLLQIKTLLVKLARESCLACLSSLQERISMLQERPTELDMFMAYQVSNIRLIASITFYLHNHITTICRDHEHVCFLSASRMLSAVCITHLHAVFYGASPAVCQI